MVLIFTVISLLVAGASVPNALPTYIKPVCSIGDGTGFGWHNDPYTGRQAYHSGLDFDVDPGYPIMAAASGRVISAEPRGPYGLAVEIDHGRGNRTRYGHLGVLAVKEGQRISQGATIGWSGATGRTLTPTLHFEIWHGDSVLDPRGKLLSNLRCTSQT